MPWMAGKVTTTAPERTGDSGPNELLGRGGDDVIDGSGDSDSCSGGEGSDRATSCELTASVP